LKQRLCFAPLPTLLLGCLPCELTQTRAGYHCGCHLVVGPEYPCLPADTLDTGFRANGVNLLGPNQWAALPFTFADAQASLTGNILVADAGGTFNLLLGEPARPPWRPLQLTCISMSPSRKITSPRPAPAAFAELNDGNCNASAGVAGSTSTRVGLVNGAADRVLSGTISGRPGSVHRQPRPGHEPDLSRAVRLRAERRHPDDHPAGATTWPSISSTSISTPSTTGSSHRQTFPRALPTLFPNRRVSA
jgi:hypothetical protein